MRWLTLAAVCLVMAGCGNDSPSKPSHPGQQVYTRYCFSCHAAGVAGAPQVGNPAAWESRLAKGREALVQATIDGIPPGMPARGLCSSCTDQELAEAVDFMIERSQPE